MAFLEGVSTDGFKSRDERITLGRLLVHGPRGHAKINQRDKSPG